MEWRDIPGFPGYKISDQAQVRGICVAELKQNKGRVALRAEGMTVPMRVRELMELVGFAYPPAQDIEQQLAHADEVAELHRIIASQKSEIKDLEARLQLCGVAL